MTKRMTNYIRVAATGLALLALASGCRNPEDSPEIQRQAFVDASREEYASLPTQRVQAVKGDSLSTLLTRNAKGYPWDVQKSRYFNDNPNAVNDQISYDKFYIVRVGTNSIPKPSKKD
jgi:hypothetical protein